MLPLNKTDSQVFPWQRYLLALLLGAIGLLLAAACRADAQEELFKAARMNNASDVANLLRRGVNPNISDPARGETALMAAARENSLKAVPVLLAARGINIDQRAKNGDTALMLAAFKKNRQVVEALLAKGALVNQDGWTALHYAAMGGDVEIIQMLLKHSAEVDARSPNLTTPLMMAAMGGNIYAVKALLDAGADLNMANEQGLTAIDFARRSNHPVILEGLEYRRKANEVKAAAAVEAEEKKAQPLDTEIRLAPMD